MKKALFVYRTSRKEVYENWKTGNEPDSRLFGSNHMSDFGVKADFFDYAYSPFNLFHPAFFLFEHAIINKIGMGFKLDQAVLLATKFNKYDVIVATGDSAGLPILFLKYLNIIKRPVIFMTAGLAGALKGNETTWVGKFYKKILRNADIFTSYSQVEIDFFKKRMGIENVKYIPLATDFNYFSQKSKVKKSIVCAVGTELGRDYRTFFDAVKNIPVKAEIACHPDNLKGLKVPDNVKVHINVPVNEVLKIYQRSLISVVPCKERYRSSGQMVVLETAAAGLPIVASGIKGLVSAFSFEDGKHLYYTKPNDPEQMRKKLLLLLNNKKQAEKMGLLASKKVKDFYTTYHLAKRLSLFIKNL